MSPQHALTREPTERYGTVRGHYRKPGSLQLVRSTAFAPLKRAFAPPKKRGLSGYQ
jgi:hypothetical protein